MKTLSSVDARVEAHQNTLLGFAVLAAFIAAHTLCLGLVGLVFH